MSGYLVVATYMTHVFHRPEINKVNVQNIPVRSKSLVPHHISACFSHFFKCSWAAGLGFWRWFIFTPFQSSHCIWSMFVLFCLFLKNKNKQKREICVCLFLNSMVKPALSLHITILCHKIRRLISLVESTKMSKTAVWRT